MAVTVSNALMDLKSFACGQASVLILRAVLLTSIGINDTQMVLQSILILLQVLRTSATAIGLCGQKVLARTRIRTLPCITTAKSSAKTKVATGSSDLSTATLEMR